MVGNNIGVKWFDNAAADLHLQVCMYRADLVNITVLSEES